uniref:Phosphorylcholine transferase LicD n=1 Tax=Prevotella sp. GTC17260 TaxID=3236796 RepID=A0AB33JGY5_9BACT
MSGIQNIYIGKMKEIYTEELKRIQLDILSDIDKFCEKEHITYFLAYGTLLGAVRHQGFIPWDDDIDIAMPRPDYDKFIRHYNSQNTEHEKAYRVISSVTDIDYGLPFAKVYDSRTSMNEYLYRQENYGVYIDVFPIDGVQRNLRQIPRALKWGKMLNTKKAIIGGGRSMGKNLIMLLGKIVLWPISKKRILKKIDTIATAVDYQDAQEVACVAAPYSERDVVNKSAIHTTVKADFEGRQFPIPVGYDVYLRHIYGDYMQLPPVEKRVSTHTFKAWWK